MKGMARNTTAPSSLSNILLISPAYPVTVAQGNADRAVEAFHWDTVSRAASKVDSVFANKGELVATTRNTIFKAVATLL